LEEMMDGRNPIASRLSATLNVALDPQLRKDVDQTVADLARKDPEITLSGFVRDALRRAVARYRSERA
jgi:hypothetical protein